MVSEVIRDGVRRSSEPCTTASYSVHLRTELVVARYEQDAVAYRDTEERDESDDGGMLTTSEVIRC